MFIKDVKINNFKCLKECHIRFNLPDGTSDGSGLNIMVGENNSGKSTLFEALYFLRNKGKSDYKRIGADMNDEFSIELTFSNNVKQVIEDFAQENKKQPFKDCVYENESIEQLTVKRTFKDQEDMKQVLFLKDDQFKNITGIDASFQAFFQISNIWADTNPEAESKFGASTVCGNLLSDISEKFKITHVDQYNKFLKIFSETFNDPTSGLQSELNKVAQETEEILNDQFGQARLKFKFETPEADAMFKNIKILVDDGEETEIGFKGHGMQRAVILSLIQVYAHRITKVEDQEGNVKLKPHFLFIDEPEMGLHPQAQRKLFDALKIISRTHQVFINTHSENFISSDHLINLFRFSKFNDAVRIYSGQGLTINLAENRKFFLHHHKLFFASRVILVEGVDDYERYPQFLRRNSLERLTKDFYFLAGCKDYSVFKILLNHFGIKAFFIFDLDVLSINNNVLKNLDDSLWSQIIRLNKTVTKKDCSNLFDVNLTTAEKVEKDAIVNSFISHDVLVLSNGALEQYLDTTGLVIGNDVVKTNELLGIFNYIAE